MNQNRFIEELKLINVELTQIQLDQLNKYYELLVEYNKIMNLTKIIEKEEVYLKHFYDSLTISKIVNLKNINSLCDIGTGAGFPGLVLKIVFPNLKVTLLDSLNKRIKFLEKVVEELELKNIEVVHARAEDYAINNRNKFDITTARAVAHTSVLLEYAIPMTKIKGYFIPLKAKMNEELIETSNVMKLLNIKLINKIEFKLPIEESSRTIILFQKEKDNNKYPRKYSEIKKSRL